MLIASGSVATLTVCGCGGSQDGESATRNFLQRGNLICRDTAKDIKAATRLAPPASAKSAVGALNEYARELIIPRRERQIVNLRRLGAPPGDEARVEKILDSMEAALAESKKRPFRFTLAKNSPYARPDRLLREYGLTKCVSG